MNEDQRIHSAFGHHPDGYDRLAERRRCRKHAGIVRHQRVHLEKFSVYVFLADAIQVVSGPIHKPTVHFEAPPSSHVPDEMKQFIRWFNDTAPGGKNPLSPLTRAGIAHLYFVCIHRSKTAMAA